MNFLSALFFVLIGSFSIGHVNTLQAITAKEIVSQAPDQNEYRHIKAIIFDCDGTLIDNGIGYFLDRQHALRCQGYALNADEFWDFMNKNRLVGAPGADEIIVKYCCELIGRECSDEILKEKKAFSAKLHANYEFPAIEPTVNFLHALGQAKEDLGLKLGLASANKKENILRVLNRLNVYQYFDVIVSADDLIEYNDPEGVNKPKPYIYLKAAKLLCLHSEQCVAIEDSRTGVSSAVSAGCITVAIPNAYTAQQDLSHAHMKVISFADITPTDFLQTVTNLKMSMQIANSLEYLKQFEGVFGDKPLSVEVSLRNNKLFLISPGMGGETELVPDKRLKFNLKGLPEHYIQFRIDDNGKVTEFIFTHPLGSLNFKINS